MTGLPVKHTVGISPKVKLPAGVLLGIGIALVVIGIAVDNDEVLNAGFGFLVSSPIGGLVGYSADPGRVQIETAGGTAGGPAERP